MKVFVSYVPADYSYAEKIRRWGTRQKIGSFEVEFTSVDDKGVRTKSGRVIKPKIEKLIKEAEFIVVIIGDNNEKHPWQRYQKFADENKIIRYYTRIPYTKDPLPEPLKDVERIAFNPNAIEKLLRVKYEPEEEVKKEDTVAEGGTSESSAGEVGTGSGEKES